MTTAPDLPTVGPTARGTAIGPAPARAPRLAATPGEVVTPLNLLALDYAIHTATCRGPARAELFGVPVDLLDVAATVDLLASFVECGRPHAHVQLNAASALAVQEDRTLLAAFRRVHACSLDGMSVVWAARMLGLAAPERVTGIDVMDSLLALAAGRRWPVYFVGAEADVIGKAVAAEQERHPGLEVAGYRDGYFTVDDEPGVAEEIARAAPAMVFVGLPTPRKEMFVDRWLQTIGAPLMVGVGGSFDVVSGKLRRAPRWMQTTGMEWTWRLAQEPRRLGPRYLKGNPQFAALALRERAILRREA